ncbi:Uncharacterised protein [Enterococcus gallinarum]|uniref:Uncharacterized protein n=1 Tax=Enterococcus gallinarum TaxID=1353 RepID=A0A376GU48_ENTGA|nr:Uncharacterised protein [Enterococcus gallinarum]STD82081.1 Uncharacterised protein [Enterococcus gallinarum]
MRKSFYFQLIRIFVYLIYLTNTTFHFIKNIPFTQFLFIITLSCFLIDIISTIHYIKKEYK